MVMAMSVAACAGKEDGEFLGANAMTGKPIEEVLGEHVGQLMAIPGVTGTAQGLCEGHPCIKVFVLEKTPELCRKIPDILEGYPVTIEETGEFRVFPEK